MEDTMPEYVGDISIRSPQRPEDVPNELEFNHSFMAQSEIDSLRCGIINLQDQRDLAIYKAIKRLEEERKDWYRKARENFKFTVDARDERDKAREDLEFQRDLYRVQEECLENAREQIKKLIYITESAISLAGIYFENDKIGVISELRDEVERIKEGAK